jgi:UDP-glucose 4-epimerase
MRVIVTGGAGFIGSHLVDMLIGLGYEVAVIDNLSTGKRKNLNPKASFFYRDICQFWKIRSLFEGVDYVFHCAALARVPLSIEKPYETHKVNVEGTINVLLASALAGVKKVIHSSSSSVYGNQPTLPLREDMAPNPVSPYGRQKRYIEEFCRDFVEPHHLKITCLRYFNVYGPRCVDDHPYSLVIGKFLKNRKEGKTSIIYGIGEQGRDFTHVDDVVLANIRAMESPLCGFGEAINIGAGKKYSINQVAQMIGGSYDWAPAPSTRQNEPRHTLADITKARELLGWEPRVSLEDGISDLKKSYGLV